MLEGYLEARLRQALGSYVHLSKEALRLGVWKVTPPPSAPAPLSP